uniref:Uncharacterized protein n=1 Tax=Eutreptiella gymnastica TaxID=73025 RepID=A0A7S4G9M3_9EUGL|mmetsp:Transcript_52313/g.85486  ORF Transcript_52313/g.85486 Transcript_52313/m.85486 type:complete len:121 (-) Transcript_52313:153-515(-)
MQGQKAKAVQYSPSGPSGCPCFGQNGEEGPQSGAAVPHVAISSVLLPTPLWSCSRSARRLMRKHLGGLEDPQIEGSGTAPLAVPRSIHSLLLSCSAVWSMDRAQGRRDCTMGEEAAPSPK